MRKNIFLLYCVIAAVLCSCNKGDDSAPSYKDVNWFDLKDDPNDPLKHLIYQVYQKTGIPVFCNDTIGQWESGFDTLGMPGMKYEILNVDYRLVNNTAPQEISYTLEHDQEKLKAGVQFVGEVLHPLLPGKVYVHSFLLTKMLISTENTRETELFGYTGFNTFVIGGIDKVSAMSSLEKNVYAQNIRNALISDYLFANFEKELEAFYLITENAKVAGITTSGSTNYNAYFNWDRVPEDPIDGKWELMGFLNYAQINYPDMFVTLKKKEDAQMFVTAFLTYTEDEFKAKYKERKQILDKYDIIKGLIKPLY